MITVPSVPLLQPHVVRSALSSVGELLTCCGLGIGANRLGLLNTQTTSALARCVYNVFLPAMLVTSVSATVAHGMGGVMAAVPAAAWVQVGVGLLIAWGVASALGIPRHSPMRNDVAVLSAFGNSGVLPLIFADALFSGHPDPTLLPLANALVAMFLLGWSPLFWTVGFSLLCSDPSDGVGDGVGDGVSAGDGGGVGGDSEHVRSPLGRRLRALLRKVLTPPIIACLVGLAVGLTPPLRAVLLPTATGTPSALPLFRCLQTFGKAYAPAAVLVLAGSLSSAPASKALAQRDAAAATAAEPLEMLPPRGLAAIMLCRFALVPLASAGLLNLAHTTGILRPSPIRDLMIMMQAVMPSAQNSVLAMQVSGNPERATRMARALLVIYIVAAVPVSLVLTLLLQQSGLAIGEC